MTTISRVSRCHRLCLSMLAGLVVLSVSYETGHRAMRSRAEAADVAPPVVLTSDEVIEALLPNLTEERMRKELAEQMDAIPEQTKAALPPGFKEKFIDKFLREGLPELKAEVKKQLKETYTESELRILLDFHRKYPKLIEKQEALAKSVMQKSMKIGARIGASLAK